MLFKERDFVKVTFVDHHNLNRKELYEWGELLTDEISEFANTFCKALKFKVSVYVLFVVNRDSKSEYFQTVSKSSHWSGFFRDFLTVEFFLMKIKHDKEPK